jgi:hypothetical protein
MSKTVKKGTCQHKFVQGTKKGKLCKKSCRGKYCKDHNKKKSIYMKKYFQEKQMKDKNFELYQKIKQIKDEEDVNNLPSTEKLEEKLRFLKDKKIEIEKTIKGIRIALGYNEDNFLQLESKQFEKSFDDLLEQLDDPDDPKNEKKKEILRKHLMATMPHGKVPFFIYTGSEKNGKLKLKKFEIELKSVEEKIKNTDEILGKVCLRIKQLRNLKSYSRKSPQEKYYENHKDEILKQQGIYRKSKKFEKNLHELETKYEK